MELEQLFLKHKGLEFPEFPEDDGFAEWVEELIEIDGYYVGIISSSIGSIKPNLDSSEIDRLTASLANFAAIEEDAEVFRKCELYLKSLRNLVEKVAS